MPVPAPTTQLTLEPTKEPSTQEMPGYCCKSSITVSLVLKSPLSCSLLTALFAPQPHLPPFFSALRHHEINQINQDSGRSTVAVKMPLKHGAMESRALHDVKVGDRSTRKTPRVVREGFTKVTGLYHSPTTQEHFRIKMLSKLHLRLPRVPHLLEATAHHTFPRCQTMELVAARQLKKGDCLNTPNGEKLVASAEKIPRRRQQQHETYTVVTEGGARDLIVVGGVSLTRAMRSNTSVTPGN